MAFDSNGVFLYDFAGGFKNPPCVALADIQAGVLVTRTAGKLVRADDMVAADNTLVAYALREVYGITINDVKAYVAAGYVVNSSQGITSDASLGNDQVTSVQAIGHGIFRVPATSITSAALEAEITWKTATSWTVAIAGDIVFGKIEAMGSGQCLIRLQIPYRKN